MKTTTTVKYGLVGIVLLTMMIAAPLATLNPASAVNEVQGEFTFSYELLEGWFVEYDDSAVTDEGGQLIDMQFILVRDPNATDDFSRDSPVRREDIGISAEVWVVRHPTDSPITMETCFEEAKWRTEDFGTNAPYEETLSEPLHSTDAVGGYDAYFTEVTASIDFWDRDTGEWEWVAESTRRAYCVDAPSGAIFILLTVDTARDLDNWVLALEFIDTFTFTDAAYISVSPGYLMCEEAFRFYGDRRMEEAGYPDREHPSALNMSESTIQDQIMSALDRYNDNFDEAYVTWTFASTLDAIDFMATGGSTSYQLFELEGTARMFTFANRESPDFPNEPVRSEWALANTIQQQFDRTGERLNPGDVFYLALQQTGGDARLAALLAHNTFRSLARHGDEDFTGVRVDRTFFTTNLEPINGFEGAELPGPPKHTDDPWDNSGLWYHLFGTMFFEMHARGDWGPVSMSILPMMELPREVLISVYNGHIPDLGIFLDDPTYASRFANAVEQWVRTGTFDPEKFCVNVWGARIGADLAQKLIASERRHWGNPGPHERPWRPRLDVPAQPGPVQRPTPEIPQPSANFPPALEAPRPVQFDLTALPGQFALGSPVSVLWESSEGTAYLDQRLSSIFGFVPIALFPMYNATSDTYGSHWFDYHTTPYTLEFEGIESGSMSLTYHHSASGRAATWIADIEDGETLRLDITPGVVDVPLIREDGTRVEPLITEMPPLNLDDLPDTDGSLAPVPTAPGVTSPDPPAGNGASPGLDDSFVFGLVVVGMLGVGFVGILLLAWMLRRPVAATRSPSESYPSPSPAPLPAKQTPTKLVSQPPLPARQDRSPATSAAGRPSAESYRQETVTKCSNCGQIVSLNDRFCHACGTPVQLPQPQSEGKASAFCRQCGRPLEADDRFCPHCGVSVAGSGHT